MSYKPPTKLNLVYSTTSTENLKNNALNNANNKTEVTNNFNSAISTKNINNNKEADIININLTTIEDKKELISN